MQLKVLATWIGGGLMVALGVVAVVALLLGACAVLAVVGNLMFRRMRRIYHLQALNYWLDRMDREGTHCVKIASQEVREKWVAERNQPAVKAALGETP